MSYRSPSGVCTGRVQGLTGALGPCGTCTSAGRTPQPQGPLPTSCPGGDNKDQPSEHQLEARSEGRHVGCCSLRGSGASGLEETVLGMQGEGAWVGQGAVVRQKQYNICIY